MANKKIYKVKITRKGRESFTEGTVEDLAKYFSYTLEIGNSYNKRINRNPKTIKSLISNVQNAYSEKEAACYERTDIDLVN